MCDFNLIDLEHNIAKNNSTRQDVSVRGPSQSADESPRTETSCLVLLFFAVLCIKLYIECLYLLLDSASKPSESVPGFQMHSEDFPALPGTTSTKASCKFSFWCMMYVHVHVHLHIMYNYLIYSK